MSQNIKGHVFPSPSLLCVVTVAKLATAPLTHARAARPRRVFLNRLKLASSPPPLRARPASQRRATATTRAEPLSPPAPAILGHRAPIHSARSRTTSARTSSRNLSSRPSNP